MASVLVGASRSTRTKGRWFGEERICVKKELTFGQPKVRHLEFSAVSLTLMYLASVVDGKLRFSRLQQMMAMTNPGMHGCPVKPTSLKQEDLDCTR